MASEQERKEAFLKVWFDAPENIHWAHGMSNGVEKDISDTFDRAIAAWNTRPAPAATDTGLVRYDLSMFGNGIVEMGGGAYVRADRAQELLAAERVRYVEASQRATNEESLKDTMRRGLLRWKERAEKSEADNAAKDAEIVGLREALIGEQSQRRALEAKLAAAEKALEPFADHAKERAVDAPEWRDTDTVQIVVTIGDLRKARAVLGGKPS